MSKICKHCQNVLDNSDRFCPKCGHQEFEKYTDKKEEKEKEILEEENLEEQVQVVEENITENEDNIPNKPVDSINNSQVKNKTYAKKSKTFGVVALILSIFLSIVALIPALIGFVYSVKAKKNKEKYKVGIVTSILAIIISIVTAGLLYYVFDNYIDESNKPIERVNYKAILKEYGKGFEEEVANYLKENMALPTFEEIEKKYEFPEHKVVCEERNINEDGTIFLNDCFIDDTEIEFSYGKFIEVEDVDSNIVYFYHVIYPDYDYYTSSKLETSAFQANYDYDKVELVNSYTCLSDDCSGQQYGDKFIVIDNETVYMATIGNSQNTFKKALPNNEYIMDIENTRYIISEYKSAGKIFMYTVNNQDEIDTLFAYEAEEEYTYYDDEDDEEILLSFNYMTLENGLVLVSNDDDYLYIYNFKTKKTVLDIPVKNNSYITFAGDENYYYLNYDYSGKRVFNHKMDEILGKNYFLSNDVTSIFSDGTIVTEDFKVNESTNIEEYLNTYSTYKNGRKVYTSEEYKRILSIHEKYALVIDQDSIVKLLNIVDNSIIASFGTWESTYSFKYISYLNYETGENDAFYFAVEDSNLHSSSSKNAGYIYTYRYSDGEFKKIKTDLDNY